MPSNRFTPLIDPPYYSVIFSNQLNKDDPAYHDMAEKMMGLAENAPGYLGAESTRDETGFGITVSYWKDLASISLWKKDTDHLQAQTKGIKEWYTHYNLRIAKVERSYEGPMGRLKSL